MITLDRDTWFEIVSEAGRAPSAHNTQPARWRLAEGRVRLFEDSHRRLPIADPENRDGEISLGAALAGMELALSRRGLGLADSDPVEPASDPSSLRPVLEGRLVEGGAEDPLAGEVVSRRTWRGAFAPADDDVTARLHELLTDRLDVSATLDRADIDSIARLHDRCAWSYLRRPEYHRELFDWIRFSPKEPGWDRDGLSTDCMALSALERKLLRPIFRPSVFRWLRILGLGPLLTSEAPAVRSASAVAVLHGPESQSQLEAGEQLYRFWLELSAAGFHACPMSATADSAAGRQALRDAGLLALDRAPINVFRIGIAPANVPESRRLPAAELLV